MSGLQKGFFDASGLDLVRARARARARVRLWLLRRLRPQLGEG
jgi:hypothetical protein